MNIFSSCLQFNSINANYYEFNILSVPKAYWRNRKTMEFALKGPFLCPKSWSSKWIYGTDAIDGNNLAFKCVLSGPCSAYPIKEFFT